MLLLKGFGLGQVAGQDVIEHMDTPRLFLGRAGIGQLVTAI